MDNDQITALAREYAEEIFKNDESNPDLSICLLNDIKFEAAADFEEKLRFLLRRYALVEKSKVEKEYNLALSSFEEAGCSRPLNQSYFEGRSDAIERLFPSIAKEVEG